MEGGKEGGVERPELVTAEYVPHCHEGAVMQRSAGIACIPAGAEG